MYTRLLVPLDGSKRAGHALPLAARIAGATRAEIMLLQVVPFRSIYTGILPEAADRESARRGDTLEAMHYLHHLTHSKQMAYTSATYMVEEGPPADVILDQAKARDVDLIVMSSHGHHGLDRWLLGNVAEHVTRHATMPVLVLHEGEHGLGSIMRKEQRDREQVVRVLVPVDGSALAEEALKPASELALALAAPERAAVHLTLIVDPFEADVRQGESQTAIVEAAEGYLAKLTAALQVAYPGLDVTWAVAVNTDVATGILSNVEAGNDTAGAKLPVAYDLIAMTTHGRSGVRRWALGSIVERVLHTSTIPVLVVHHRLTDAYSGRAADDTANRAAQ